MPLGLPEGAWCLRGAAAGSAPTRAARSPSSDSASGLGVGHGPGTVTVIERSPLAAGGHQQAGGRRAATVTAEWLTLVSLAPATGSSFAAGDAFL